MIKKPLTAFLLTVFCFTSLLSRVEAAEFLTGAEILIGPEEILNADVYITAGRVIVDGTINGDLLAAGETIEVNGQVNGDLIVAGRVIRVRGIVEDDIRAAGADLQFLSEIGGDLITSGNQIRIEADSVIGEDLVVAGNTLIARGEVAGNLELSVAEANIEGTVRGNINAIVENHLILGPDSIIEGELTYTSLNDVTMQSGAEVMGDVTKYLPVINLLGSEYQISTFIQVVSKIITQVKWFIGTILVGLVLLWLLPETIGNVKATLLNSPWKSLLLGLLILPVAPVLFILIMIIALSTLGFSLFPFVAVPASMYGVLLLLAKPLIAISIGTYVVILFKTQKVYAPWKELVIGAALLAALGVIPFIDSMAGWLSIFFGFGAWLLFFYRRYHETRVTQNV